METLLAMPMTIFALLGILQMCLLYQARFAAEYAAFRATRAGSLGRVDCQLMKDAALQALLPTLTRTDEAGEGGAGTVDRAWDYVSDNQYQTYWAKHRQGSPFPGASPHIVDIKIDPSLASAQGKDFDIPANDASEIPHLTVELTYWYEMRIPFANYVIHEAWEMVSYFSPNADPIHLTTEHRHKGGSPRYQENQVYDAAREPGYKGAYLVPVRASWSMRLMSNLAGAPPSQCQ